MNDEDVTRRLAAIMAVDVVGYSRLMNLDEAATHAEVSACLETIVETTIAQHKGRTVKFTGDGLLAEFPSAVEGVQCAVDIQHAMGERAAKLFADVAEDRRVIFRIGVNLGDIIIEDHDIFGDGVNVAARIEGLADPGGVFISSAVSEQISGKLDVALEDLGNHTLKHIAQPVHVFRVLFDGARSGSASGLQAEPTSPANRLANNSTWAVLVAVGLVVGGVAIWTQLGGQSTPPAPPPVQAEASKPTIAVLPFENLSNDQEQEYFSDGLTEDLIIDISKISGVSVFARNSTNGYKGQSPDVRAVGSELGASHVIEGSVRRAGNLIRITVQLVDAADGRHLWAERYDRELKDVFAIQDEVIGQIIAALSLRLTPHEQQRVARRGTDNLEAYDLFMRGREQESFFNKDAFVEARRYFEEAIALDPDYAVAYAHLAQIHAMNGQFNWVDDIAAADQRALKLAEKSAGLGPDVPYVHFSLSRILARDSIGQHDRSIAELKKAIELDANYADAYAFLGQLYILTGKAEQALEPIKIAMRSNPNFPFWYHYTYGFAQYFMGDYAAAVENIEKAIDRNPSVIFIRTAYAASLALDGRQEDAEWQIDELFGLGFDLTLDELIGESPIVHPPYLTHLRKGLAKAGME